MTGRQMASRRERPGDLFIPVPELAALEAAHPDWRDIANSIEFNDYVRSLPAQVATLAQSDKARDVDYLLQQYKATRGNATPKAQTPTADSSITQRRQESLRQAAQPPASSTTGRKPVGKDDFDGAFAAFAARAQKR